MNTPLFFRGICLLPLPVDLGSISLGDILKAYLYELPVLLQRCRDSNGELLISQLAVDGLFDVDVDHGAVQAIVTQQLLHVEDVLGAVVLSVVIFLRFMFGCSTIFLRRLSTFIFCVSSKE